jgi:hypothetical protein
VPPRAHPGCLAWRFLSKTAVVKRSVPQAVRCGGLAERLVRVTSRRGEESRRVYTLVRQRIRINGWAGVETFVGFRSRRLRQPRADRRPTVLMPLAQRIVSISVSPPSADLADSRLFHSEPTTATHRNQNFGRPVRSVGTGSGKKANGPRRGHSDKGAVAGELCGARELCGEVSGRPRTLCCQKSSQRRYRPDYPKRGICGLQMGLTRRGPVPFSVA